jgi:hypothetical protein
VGNPSSLQDVYSSSFCDQMPALSDAGHGGIAAMPIRTIAVVILFATAFVSSLAMEAAPAGGFNADKLLNVRSTLQSAIRDRQMSGVVTAVWRNGVTAGSTAACSSG